jgi:hypothetical protein
MGYTAEELRFGFENKKEVFLYSKAPRQALVIGGVIFPGFTRPGPEDPHSPPFGVEIKDEWNNTSAHLFVFMENQASLVFTSALHLLRGGAVVEALRYKPEGREFDSRWCHWNFSLT